MTLAALLSLVLLLSACAEAGDPTPGTLPGVRDSAGVAVVELGHVAYADLPRWTLGDEPAVSIGVREGAPEFQFTDVVDVRRAADGGFAVLDRGAFELRRYDPDGAHLWSAGREGSGPGDFAYPAALLPLAGDSMAVWDVVRRLTVFGQDGSAARVTEVDGVTGVPLLLGTPSPGAVLFYDRIVELKDEPPWVFLDWSWDFVLRDLEGRVVDTLLTRPVQRFYRKPDDVEATHEAIFSVMAMAASADGGLWFADGSAYALERYDLDGRLTRVVRWQGPDRTGTRDERGRWLAWAMDDVGATVEVAPSLRAWYLNTFSDWPVADRFPAFQEIMVDRAGRIWLRDYVKEHRDDGTRRWTVLSPDAARPLARVTHPSDFDPTEIGEDWVLGVHEDELGVERVHLRRLVR